MENATFRPFWLSGRPGSAPSLARSSRRPAQGHSRAPMTCPGARQNPARPAKKLAKTVGKRYFSALLALWPPRERLKPAKKLQKACPGPTQRAHDLPRSSPEPGKACPRPPKASRGAREGLPRAALGRPGPAQELARTRQGPPKAAQGLLRSPGRPPKLPRKAGTIAGSCSNASVSSAKQSNDS